MCRKQILIYIISLYYSLGFSQTGFKIPDSLSGKNQNYLTDKIEENLGNKALVKTYSKIFLAEAKANSDWKQMVKAYGYLLHSTELTLKLYYADSIVYSARQSRDNSLLAAAYITKGNVYYNLSDPKKALDNYLLADKLVDNTSDEYLSHKIKFHIGQTKFYLGFYDEAIALFKDCMDYFLEVDDRPYLNSLHGLSLCYNRLHQYEKCSQLNAFGTSEAIVCEIDEMVVYFTHNEGVNQYFRKNYKEAIEKLSGVLPKLLENKDLANATVADFYIAKSYLALKQTDLAMGFLNKVDRALLNDRLVTPDLRESFELQINYYKSVNNLEKQLLYINRLLSIDKRLDSNYKYLSGRIFKEYDTKKLLQSKSAIEQSFVREKQMKYLFVIITIVLMLTILFLVHRHFKIQKRNRQKFEELMSKNPRRLPLKKPLSEENLGINPEVIESILQQLEKFELEKKFLKQNLTQVKLAAMFKTNTTYLSKIIPYYKGKKTNDYLNDLKIEYILERLKTQSKYKNYTFKALGEEAGFSTTQHFTKAFGSYTGITLSYFIQELKKKQNQAC